VSWQDVGQWVQANAGAGAALVGSLITGNVPGAVAAGVALVSSATGTNDPAAALLQLQTDPATLVRLKELALQNDASIRSHIEAMTALEMKNAADEHHETQETVRAGDRATGGLQWVRPIHASLALVAAIVYAFYPATPSFEILAALLSLPLAYSGLRQLGKYHELKMGESP
jgi:hypothetical protein